MPLEGRYEPSPWQPIADQVRTYEESERDRGHRPERAAVRDPLDPRPPLGHGPQGPLMRVTDGTRYAVVASLGGSPKHPVWYLNLDADPHVSLQDGAELRDYTARVVEGDERAALVGPGPRGLARLRRVPGEDRPGDPGGRARPRLIQSPGLRPARRGRRGAPAAAAGPASG